MSKAKAEQIVDCILGSMEGTLMRGGRVELRGFGSFEVRHYDGYDGRNPRTGIHVVVAPKRQAFFNAGREMKARVASAATNTKLKVVKVVAR